MKTTILFLSIIILASCGNNRGKYFIAKKINSVNTEIIFLDSLHKQGDTVRYCDNFFLIVR